MLCAPMTSQVAALEALENPDSFNSVESMRLDYKLRRDFVVRRLNQMGLECHLPGGAFYVFPEVSKFGLTSQEFALKLLEEENVAAVPGTAFGEGGEGFLRCCYATAFDQLELAMDKMEAFVGRLKGA